MPQLVAEITGIRPYDGRKAIDLLWRADDNSAMRGDGALAVEDQIEIAPDATDQQVTDAISARRQYLAQYLEAPGVGLSVDPPATLVTINSTLIGQTI